MRQRIVMGLIVVVLMIFLVGSFTLNHYNYVVDLQKQLGEKKAAPSAVIAPVAPITPIPPASAPVPAPPVPARSPSTEEIKNASFRANAKVALTNAPKATADSEVAINDGSTQIWMLTGKPACTFERGEAVKKIKKAEEGLEKVRAESGWAIAEARLDECRRYEAELRENISKLSSQIDSKERLLALAKANAMASAYNFDRQTYINRLEATISSMRAEVRGLNQAVTNRQTFTRTWTGNCGEMITETIK